MLETITQQIQEEARKIEQEMWDIAIFLHEHPESGSEEFQAVAKLTGILEAYNFTIEKNIANLKTAFRATYTLHNTSSPAIAYIAEYDALPEIGHACGHNVIAAMSVGAGIVLSKIEALQGQIMVIGTPDEERRGGKIPLVHHGIFDRVDAAMMVHPGNRHVKRKHNLAAFTIIVEFHGKPSHAAGVPFEGINALDAMIQLFNSVGLLRQQLTDDVRIHGIITHGGIASNIIPDYTRAEFLVRASELDRSYQVVEKFKNCVKGAALATGTKESIKVEDTVYEPLMTNNVLMESYAGHMKTLGIEVEEQSPSNFGGSSDIGNVSQVVPAIHPSIQITEPGQEVPGHSQEFTLAAKSECARTAMLLGIQALAMCGADLLGKPETLNAVKQAFRKTSTKSGEDD